MNALVFGSPRKKEPRQAVRICDWDWEAGVARRRGGCNRQSVGRFDKGAVTSSYDWHVRDETTTEIRRSTP